MARYCNTKFLSTSQDTYRHPYRDQIDYKHFQPQSNSQNKNDYYPNKGTKKWFQDYRRTDVEEQCLRNNLYLSGTLVRPTKYNDKPDRALGARKQERESLFPVIHNNPVYVLTNINSDKIQARDIGFMNQVKMHRAQIKDLTGSKHKKVDMFYFPFPSSETFNKRNVSESYITDFPSHHTSANEYIFRKPRTEPLINHNDTDVVI